MLQWIIQLAFLSINQLKDIKIYKTLCSKNMNLNKCNDLNMMNIIILIVMSRRKARSTLYFVILLQDFRILNKYETVDNCHFAHHHQQQQTPYCQNCSSYQVTYNSY